MVNTAVSKKPTEDVWGTEKWERNLDAVFVCVRNCYESSVVWMIDIICVGAFSKKVAGCILF